MPKSANYDALMIVAFLCVGCAVSLPSAGDLQGGGGGGVGGPEPLSFNVIPSVLVAPGQNVAFKVTANYPNVRFTIVDVKKNGEALDITSHPIRNSLNADSGDFSWTPQSTDIGSVGVALLATQVDTQATATAVAYVTVSNQEICESPASWCTYLKQRFAAGAAAGSYGDYYQNNDGLHTNLSATRFPQLIFLPPQIKFEEGYTPGKVIVGNASRAMVSPWPSSFVRFYTLGEGFEGDGYLQYINNTHYWHPEHKDHDLVDYFFGKVPFISNSQGSSGSEMDEITNSFVILAAFQPQVKAILKSQGLLMPTLAMISRRARVASDAVYLTGAAHPTAFDNTTETEAMARMANGMEASTIPPMVQLKVVSETYEPVEKWFETLVSICRIFKGNQYTKSITVSAADSFDYNNRPLTYTWSVLRGEPSKVRITPLNSLNSVATIEFDYHAEAAIDGSGRLSNLAEVGVFVHNGSYYSAPGFITDYTQRNQTRTYNGSGNLISNVPNSNYIDPRFAN